jgi:hydroxyethylthiazole kinase
MRSRIRAVAPSSISDSHGSWPLALVGDTFSRLKRKAPRVHCFTNTVAQAFTANLLLAAGAIPSMTVAPEEIGQFMRRADALLVNLGTLDAERRAALPIALDAARQRGIPVILDPVFVDASAPRLALAREIIAAKPAIVRLNAAEFQALTGDEPTPRAVASYVWASEAVIALTGSSDIVCDGARLVRIHNGHPFMAQVTAMGCAAGALIAALTAACADPFAASLAGLTMLGVAGEIAASEAKGPGSFVPIIIDTLASLDHAALAAHARFEAEEPPEELP